jgi:hypothetical protein
VTFNSCRSNLLIIVQGLVCNAREGFCDQSLILLFICSPVFSIADALVFAIFPLSLLSTIIAILNLSLFPCSIISSHYKVHSGLHFLLIANHRHVILGDCIELGHVAVLFVYQVGAVVHLLEGKFLVAFREAI